MQQRRPKYYSNKGNAPHARKMPTKIKTFDKTLVYYRIRTQWYRTYAPTWTRMGNRYGQVSRRKMAKRDSVHRNVCKRKDYKLHYKIYYKDGRMPQRIYWSNKFDNGIRSAFDCQNSRQLQNNIFRSRPSV